MSDVNSISKARGELLDVMRGLLVGPLADGETLVTEAVEVEPTEIYLTGILWPQNSVVGAEEDENNEKADSTDTDSDDDSGAPLFSILKPSAIGLTCSIGGIDTAFEVIIWGAHYEPTYATGEAKGSIHWERIPFEYRVPLAGAPNWRRTSNFLDRDGNNVEDSEVEVYVKHRVRDGNQVVTVSFLNRQVKIEGESAGRLCVYQAGLEVRAVSSSGSGQIVARHAGFSIPDEDAKVGTLLYRDYQEFAVGHGIATSWPEPKDGKVTHVKTEWMPTSTVFSVSRSGDETLTALRAGSDSPFSAARLSDVESRADNLNRLEQLAAAYETWIVKREKRANGFPLHFRDTAGANLRVCRDTLGRIRDGVKLLAENDRAFRAFCLANRAMNDQSQGRQRGSDAKPLEWFPFQIAFLLLSIRSIVEPEHESRGVMDLLWFPTGGGKTEAYLGLTAFTIFYRRLASSNPVTTPHVDVLMRYTLRLLTVQQFQRAAALICAAEQIRKLDGDLGTQPISIGLYVGEGATPNRLVEGKTNAYDAIQAERNGLEPSSTPRLLLNCPLCGTDLTPECYDVDSAIPTLKIKCAEQTCPSFGERLPVYTVDEDIYQVRPSLVIGTVDKFAQLPRKQEQGSLFGHPDGTPPELIIQDELHLISGPLGTVTGLYEACIDLLSTRDGHPPKIVGSTATIGRAREQVAALFHRDVLQFPPPGLDADNSFFAVTDRAAPDRLYVGLSSSGRSPKFTLQAVTAASLVAAEKLRSESVADEFLDPFWTQLLYFNSLRELGGAEVMMHDDVPRTLAFYAGRLGITPRELQGEPSQLNSRVTSTKIPQILRDLGVGLEADPFAGEPIDLVLASNMISVGMDVPRLGLMIVNGQPKTTSEYIQATSRVGRGIPGLIFTIYNGARPRDTSHFEHFSHYHQVLYQRVEVTSVTPWSSRARDRALHAVFIAAVRHLIPALSGRFGAAGFDATDREVGRIRDWLVKRARGSGEQHVSMEEIEEDLQLIIDRWAMRSKKFQTGGKFEYWAVSRPFDNRPVNPHLMRGAEDPVVDPWVWPTPNSMREVEPSAYYVLWTGRSAEDN